MTTRDEIERLVDELYCDDDIVIGKSDLMSAIDRVLAERDAELKECVELLRDLRDGPINASDYADSAAQIDALLARIKGI